MILCIKLASQFFIIIYAVSEANLENLRTRILDELDFPFSIVGITETPITNEDLGGFNYNIPGYSFEYVPTPLSAGGVGVYIRDDYDYFVIEKGTISGSLA